MTTSQQDDLLNLANDNRFFTSAYARSYLIKNLPSYFYIESVIFLVITSSRYANPEDKSTDEDKAKVSLYPNPANEYFSVNYDWGLVANSGDGNYIVGTAYAEWDTIMSNYDDFSARSINILKLDSNGNEIWNKKYGTPEINRTVTRIKILPNKRIIVVGHYVKIDNINPPHQYNRAWALLLSSSGDSIWYKEYCHSVGEAISNHLNDIKPTPDGGYIACGEFWDGLNGVPQSLWVLKLESNGWYYEMGGENYLPIATGIRIFPNPTTDYANIDLSDFKDRKNLKLYIFNNQQQLLKSIEIKDEEQLRIDLRAYASGFTSCT